MVNSWRPYLLMLDHHQQRQQRTTAAHNSSAQQQRTTATHDSNAQQQHTTAAHNSEAQQQRTQATVGPHGSNTTAPVIKSYVVLQPRLSAITNGITLPCPASSTYGYQFYLVSFLFKEQTRIVPPLKWGGFTVHN